MLLFNEQHQQLNVQEVKAALKDLNDVPTLTQSEVQKTLGTYYQNALDLEGRKYQFKTDFETQSAESFLPRIGSGIWDTIRKFICGIVNGSSSSDEIIEAILQAISSIIPGGTIIIGLVKMVVKYILSIGIDKFCAV